MEVTITPHPLLDVRAFLTRYNRPLSKVKTPAEVLALFSPACNTPLKTDDNVRKMVRDLLRYGGFKPTGRSKPASEYLIKAVEKGWFGPERGINLAVDVGNVVSLHSGLPISVIDADLALTPWSVDVMPAGTQYVFNPSGQNIDIGRLISFCDQNGPCAGPVKDSQRTKTHDETQQTLTVIWGTQALPGRTEEALNWYHLLLSAAGVVTEPVHLISGDPS